MCVPKTVRRRTRTLKMEPEVMAPFLNDRL